MKNALIIAGAGLAAYGVYKAMSKSSGCGCKKQTTPASADVPATSQIYPSQALEKSNTNWHAIFNTPTRIVPDDLTADDPASAQNFVM